MDPTSALTQHKLPELSTKAQVPSAVSPIAASAQAIVNLDKTRSPGVTSPVSELTMFKTAKMWLRPQTMNLLFTWLNDVHQEVQKQTENRSSRLYLPTLMGIALAKSDTELLTQLK